MLSVDMVTRGVPTVSQSSQQLQHLSDAKTTPLCWAARNKREAETPAFISMAARAQRDDASRRNCLLSVILRTRKCVLLRHYRFLPTTLLIMYNNPNLHYSAFLISEL
jgi:hypothetical protein